MKVEHGVYIVPTMCELFITFTITMLNELDMVNL